MVFYQVHLVEGGANTGLSFSFLDLVHVLLLHPSSVFGRVPETPDMILTLLCCANLEEILHELVVDKVDLKYEPIMYACMYVLIF